MTERAELGPVVTGMTYKKGAWFLHMLREKMGYETFKMGIQSYYKKYFNAMLQRQNLFMKWNSLPLKTWTPF